ncbi:response regulator [Draconibacterium orientale]|uniref:response regulator n=1 Tax=Draconibacterium orientale TaxID=1168034 RepID=UPI002A0A1AB1|nr:response regulator [Draconibacterium orientale]
MVNSTLKNAYILIVDDQEANIDVLADLLEIQGYRNVRSTTDSREVAGLISASRPDLILLDLLMPHLSGFDVLDQIKTIVPEKTYLPVLVLTADINIETKQRALANGATDFVTKPFDLVEVGLRIKNLLETKYLHQQLEDQNLILEDKVKERTKELELTNSELIIARDKAQESNRLKTAFLSNISHEVRTPLNGILGFAQFVIQPDITMDQKEEYLEILNLSSTRLMNTITDIMDISRIISGNMEVHPKMVNISTLLKSVFTVFQESAKKKKLEFNMQFPENTDELTLNTDEDLLRKAISKLVDNSVKFTQEGSVILGFKVIHNEIEIFVKDTGQGIDDDKQELIFENFMQEDVSSTRGHEGSGLVLSIARGLIQLLGGKIRIVSTKNEGTVVFLTLPNSTSSASSTAVNSTKPVTAEEKPTILIAEDDDYSYLYVETLLKNEKIMRAHNGQEAVDFCKKYPEISLVLMDIKMPVMNGMEATRIIKSFRNDLPIIALTAYAEIGIEHKIKEADCDDYISKPFTKTKLLAIIQKYFKKQLRKD